eukprot:TRINITY_DN34792_c0_g1_i2.p1 TRINITY_DN34792_c0_g1~~TRINITY_DN34792_c0_g1_i2.p1  ORF type:complete len:530 (-),score=104.44 TRINITY_DN34792_c0_g1_i2:2639-4228(-)
MASALLASRNEPYWGERKVYMRKNPNSNPRSNPNPNPNHPGKAIFDSADRIHVRQVDESAAVNAAASDDSSSLNRKSVGLGRRESSAAAAVVVGGYINYNIAALSRRELRELKNRLIAELDQVRSLSRRIEREFQTRSGYSTSNILGAGAGVREVTSSTSRARPPTGLNPPAVDPGSDKEKRSPYGKSNFPTGRDKMPPPAKVSGSKRPLPPPSVSISRDPKRPMLDSPVGKVASGMMKCCSQILGKLMNHKPHWVFNKPVDVVALGLHDYRQIIKQPMDLGTVKSKMKKNLYSSPLDFAADVRLTFNNAMIYNPRGHEVHTMAEQLLARFEEMFGPVHRSYDTEQRTVEVGHLQRNPFSKIPASTPPEKTKRPSPPPAPVRHPSPAPLVRHPSPPIVRHPSPPRNHQAPVKPAGMRSSIGKQPKPKAKDPNKREMSYEEKQKLSQSLQSLPQEKMDQVVQIIRRRNSNLAQNGDEIEVDIEAVDTETLWELERFVCNCKKMMSKIKRQALLSQVAATETATTDGNKVM